MKVYIGYIRVSTPKQGTTGVSLHEQRDAILAYAQRNRFPISVWLKEIETAAKHGRPVFNEALKLLRQGKAQGIILHKLDRGARNLRDWAAIGELSDEGIEVHFVNEGLNLHSRGGRLSADIQAVVAADFIRNLREEARKGFYGRLKQGLYPLRAPLGYLDRGKGQAKIIDPIKGPLVRKAFELYGSGLYSLDTLGNELYRSGLRNHNGGRVTRNGLSTLLNNSFYIGIIRIRLTKETFIGGHVPLISKTLFDRVQAVLTGKSNRRTQRHTFLFRRMLSCATCEFSLIGERQKGHVYYRCHSKTCQTCIREENVELGVSALLKSVQFNQIELEYFKEKLPQLQETLATRQEDEARSLNLRLGQIRDRLNRLLDAYLERALDKATFEERKTSLLLEQKTVEENIANLNANELAFPDRLQKFLELTGNAWLSHEMALPEEKREMLDILTSNRRVDRKALDFKPSLPFLQMVNRPKREDCSPQQDIPRIWEPILEHLSMLNKQGLLPDLSLIAGFQKKDTEERKPDKDAAICAIQQESPSAFPETP